MSKSKKSHKAKKPKIERELRERPKAGYGPRRWIILVIVGLVILGLVGSTLLGVISYFFT